MKSYKSFFAVFLIIICAVQSEAMLSPAVRVCKPFGSYSSSTLFARLLNRDTAKVRELCSTKLASLTGKDNTSSKFPATYTGGSRMHPDLITEPRGSLVGFDSF
ncbi:MAG: hypothetical protein LBM19_04005, partial [Holosporales bacterium]|nr:hypothetical protein [Holosporales bacterium]